MSWNWDGLMKLVSGKYMPEWSDPCGGDDVTGLMELENGKYKPKIESAGICDELDGIMVKDNNGKYFPRIVLEHENACCVGVDCPSCTPELFPEGKTPKYIRAYITGVTACAGKPEPPNDHEFILTQSDGLPCRWETTEEINGYNWRFLWYIYIETVPQGTSKVIVQVGCTDDKGKSGNCFYYSMSGKCSTSVTNLFSTEPYGIAKCGDSYYSVFGINGYAYATWGNREYV